MDLGAAFNAIFQDRDWGTKFLIAALIVLFSAILSPLLIGLIGAVVLIGYQVEIVRRVRAGAPTALPVWDDYAAHLAQGFPAALAYFIYMLPLLVLAGVMALLSSTLGDALLGGLAIAAISCCLMPFALVYFFAASAVYALGMNRYATERRAGAFYEVDTLLRIVWREIAATFQYTIVIFLLTILLALVALIPCFGWIAAPTLGVLMGAILGAQYADAALPKAKR